LPNQDARYLPALGPIKNTAVSLYLKGGDDLCETGAKHEYD
jgi:hypothetical protein